MPPPGNKPEECPEGKTPCSNLWLKEGTAAFTDCNDLNADVFPGAWDGPAFQPRPYGIVAPGLKVEFFKIPAVPAIPDFATLQPESATRTDVTINYNFGQGSIGEGLPVDIGARWTGSIVVPEDGEYTFSPESDDGVRLWVGDLQAPVVDDWTSHYPVEHTAKIQLLKGTYPLKLEWFDHHLGGSIILRWEGPGISKQPMTVVLEPTAAQQINRCGDGLDNNCDGTADNSVIQTKGNGSVLAVGCNAECDPVDPDPTKNVTRLCGNSPEGVGICHKGSQYCRPDGTWSQCTGEQSPQAETCNELDDNCDGQVDNGAKIEYCRDADGDTYCDLAFQCGNFACQGTLDGSWRPRSSCAGNGDPGKNTDCNDSDSTNFPGNAEVCDGKDNNCDGQVDNGVSGVGATCNVANSNVGACNGGGQMACTGSSLQCVGPMGPGSDFHTTAAPNGSWDWNCNGVKELECNQVYCSDLKDSASCNGGFQNACAGFPCGSQITASPCKWSGFACQVDQFNINTKQVTVRCK